MNKTALVTGGSHNIGQGIAIVLAEHGYDVAITYNSRKDGAVETQKEIEKLGLPQDDLRNDPMPILNPLGEDAAVMRPTLACGMLRTLAFNMNHSTAAARLYEMAAVFDHHHRTQEGLPTETQTCLLYTSDAADEL